MTNARIRRQVDKDPVEGALITNTGPASADLGATLIHRPLRSRLSPLRSRLSAAPPLTPGRVLST